MEILIVEDNEDSRNLLVKVVRAYGHEVMAAADGAEALEQALVQPPDIIVSDILMPKMDGYQLCQECKQNERLKNIPFVFYSATYTLDEDKKFALSLGADAFILKPTEPDILIQMLSEMVEKAKSGALAPPEVAPLESSVFVAEHDKRIFAKLEDKVTQLEAEITKRRQAEERLRQSEENLKAHLENVPDGIYINDLKGTFLYGNIKAEEITGYNREQLIGKSFLKLKLLPAKYLAKAGKLLALNVIGRPTGPDEFELIRKDGSRISVEISATPIKQEGKTVVVGLVRDITERKQAEEKVKQTAEEWSTTFDSITDFVSICDKDFRLVRVNKAFADAFKTKPEELIGKHCYEIVHGTNEPVLNCPHKKTLETRKPATAEFFEPLLGMHLELSTSPIFNEQGEVVASVHLIRDITERKQAEEDLSRLYEEVKELNLELEERVKERTGQLEEAVQGAELANRAKSDFLASMSHELRTPLNAVIGFSQVLQEQYFGKLNEKQAEYVTDILESGQHLLSLINDILDLSKIEAGKMELELSGVKIKDLLEGSLIMIKEKALVHGISLDIDTTGDLEGLEIMADERRIKQVMFNLLSNAVKFTPDGGAITVKGKKEGKELIISVSDTGIGIASEDQERVFGEFYQANSGSLKDKTPGTGLGLPVTRSIVEMHGGRIWVESEGPGKGSRFTFTLPV